MADKSNQISIVNVKRYRVSASDISMIKQVCLSYKIIASDNNVTVEVIKTRIKRIMEEFGVENRAALVIKVIRLKLLSEKDFIFSARSNGKD